MKRDGRPGTPWKRRDSESVAAVVTALGTRQLKTLEDCERLWKAAGDPLALAVALTRVDLPAWLRDGLLAAFADDGATRVPRIFARQWRKRNRDAVQATRALEVARIMGSPARLKAGVTWELGGKLAAHVAPGDVAGTDRAMVKSYERVARNLARDPWLYYAPPRGFKQQYLAALRSLHRVLSAVVRSSREKKTKSREKKTKA